MTATIELPNNKIELAFILEVLNRLNIRIDYNALDMPLSQEVVEEHAVVLSERRAAMSAPDAQFFTWEEAQKILSNRKKAKK